MMNYPINDNLQSTTRLYLSFNLLYIKEFYQFLIASLSKDINKTTA